MVQGERLEKQIPEVLATVLGVSRTAIKPVRGRKNSATDAMFSPLGRTFEVKIDFLIPPSTDADQGGTIRSIEPDFAAMIAPGLALAFEDRDRVRLDGRTILGERTTRDVWVCGPGTFVVLKALAFDLRGESKDAYDLFYMIRNYGTDVQDVVARLRLLLATDAAHGALAILHRDSQAIDGMGPRRVADFLLGTPDDAIQADVIGFVGRLLDGCATT